VLLAWPLAASDECTRKATTSVPFNFVVNGTTLPAGDYQIMLCGTNSLSIQNINKPDYEAFVLNRNVVLNGQTFQKDTKLIFTLNNGQHVLHRIAVANDDHIHDIVHGDDVVELVATH